MTCMIAGAPVNIYIDNKIYTFASEDWEEYHHEITDQLISIGKGWAV